MKIKDAEQISHLLWQIKYKQNAIQQLEGQIGQVVDGKRGLELKFSYFETRKSGEKVEFGVTTTRNIEMHQELILGALRKELAEMQKELCELQAEMDAK